MTGTKFKQNFEICWIIISICIILIGFVSWAVLVKAETEEANELAHDNLLRVENLNSKHDTNMDSIKTSISEIQISIASIDEKIKHNCENINDIKNDLRDIKDKVD